MRNLFNFLVKYAALIIFLLLEAVSFYLLTNTERFANSVVYNASNNAASKLESFKHETVYYFRLKEVNDSLANENMRLYERLSLLENASVKFVGAQIDTIDSQRVQNYRYLLARVIRVETGQGKNYLFIDKGREDGVGPNMGVFNQNGLVGKVVSASRRYAVVMSVLHQEAKISVKLKNNRYIGSVEWTGKDDYHVSLKQIPNHLKVKKGDEVITSGYSSFYPAGILVGTVSGIRNEAGSNFYDIDVLLSTDFRSIEYVYVVTFLQQQELNYLESQINE